MHTEFAEWPNPDRTDFTSANVLAVYDYWQSLPRSADGLTLRSACDPIVDIPRLTPILTLVDIADPSDISKMTYRLVGSDVVDRMGFQSGTTVKDGYVGPDWLTVESQHRYVIEHNKPHLVRRQLGTVGNSWFRLYERILLPLSVDGQTVNQLLAAFMQMSFAAHTDTLLDAPAKDETPRKTFRA